MEIVQIKVVIPEVSVDCSRKLIFKVCSQLVSAVLVSHFTSRLFLLNCNFAFSVESALHFIIFLSFISFFLFVFLSSWLRAPCISSSSQARRYLGSKRTCLSLANLIETGHFELRIRGQCVISSLRQLLGLRIPVIHCFVAALIAGLNCEQKLKMQEYLDPATFVTFRMYASMYLELVRF